MTSDFSAAVHALVYLGHQGATVSSEALAENVCTHPARIRKIMAKLVKAGMICAREGKAGGGYALKSDASAITLGAVLRALGENMITTCWKPGNRQNPCAISSGMAAVLDSLYNKLDTNCMDELERVTVRDIENRIFAKPQL
jgi:Rrf2 family protein